MAATGAAIRRLTAPPWPVAVGVLGGAVVFTSVLSASIPLLLLGSAFTGFANAAGNLGRYIAADMATPERRASALGLVVWGTTIGAVIGLKAFPAALVGGLDSVGEVRGDTLTEGVEEARALLEQLAEAGVDYDDVTDTLEREGVQKFSDSFEELLDGIRAKVGVVAAG